MNMDQFNVDAIPDALKKRDQWVNWIAKPKDNGKVTKIPTNYRTGGQASSTNPATWGSVDDIDGGIIIDGYTGGGYVFTSDDGVVGVDLDNCFQSNGELKTWARDVVDRLDSYTEISPSGNGLHVIVLSGATEMSFNKDGREMYSEGRYFTFTGNVFEGRTELNDRDTEVRALYLEWRKRSNADKFEKAGKYTFDTSVKIIPLDKIGMSPDMLEKFKHGIGVDKNDRSGDLYAAVQQMIGIGVNDETIITHCTDQQYFLGQVPHSPSRADGDMRRARYWLWTQMMAKARQVVTAAVKAKDDMLDQFDEFDDDDDEFVDDEKELRPAYSKSWEMNANTYLDTNGLVRHKQQFYNYGGKSWEVLEDEIVEHDISNACWGFGLAMTVVDQTIKAVRRRSVIREFNPSSSKIAFDNGVLDLVNWEYNQVDMTLMDHDPEFHILSCMQYEYKPEAKCAKWLEFLQQVFEKDDERIQLLQQWFGYSLIYDYRFQKMLVMIGESRSGKGVITKILQSMIGGEAFVGTTMSNMSGDFGLDAIKSAKVASIGDAHRAPKDRIERVKEILLNVTGGDEVMVNRKNKKELPVTIPARLMLAANRFPNFIDEYDALLNRYLVLPFNVTFAGRENVTLFEELKLELPGIFNWALKGLLDLGESGAFVTPAAGEIRKQQIREQQNPVGAFIKEFMTVGNGDKVLTDELYSTYERFCEERSLFKDDRRVFGKRISSITGVEKIRLTENGARVHYYTNIGLKDPSHLYTAFTDFDEFE